MEFSADSAADVVPVEVIYTLGSARSTAVLLVERAGTTAIVLDERRVLDPLLVLVSVRSGESAFTTASLAAATVPIGGELWCTRRFTRLAASFPGTSPRRRKRWPPVTPTGERREWH
ncbi:hypothetical protein L3Q67_35795 [Saccharothrix sp. AJ9571]|nr:hypothetical protein L3Q67_35795 [Saccharothrix sp. AJ9571]